MSGHSGQYIILSALPSSHYTFNGYSVTGGVLSGDKIIIGNSDITAQASWIEDPKYSLTITQTNGGKVTANKSTGYAGDQVTLSNTPSSHYTFGSYDITGATLTGNKFNFVNQNVTAKGIFVQDPVRSIILQQTSGGIITATPMTGYDGTTVVLTNTANAGCSFSGYLITGAILTGNRFNLTGSNVTAKGIFSYVEPTPKYYTAAGIFAVSAGDGYVSGTSLSNGATVSPGIRLQPLIRENTNIPSEWVKNINGSSFFVPTTAIQASGLNELSVYIGYVMSIDGKGRDIYSWQSTSSQSAYSAFPHYTRNDGHTDLWLSDRDSWYHLFPHGAGGGLFTNGYTQIGNTNNEPAMNNHWNVVPRFYVDIDTTMKVDGGNAGYFNYDYRFTDNTGYNSWWLSGCYLSADPTTRTLNIQQQTGGTVRADTTTGLDGTIVTLSNTANAGYTFNNYSITGAKLTGSQFKFYGQNVTIKPNYTHNVYNLYVRNDGNGKLSANTYSGYYGSTARLTPTPKEDYKFGHYDISGAGSVNGNIFTFGAGSGLVKANFDWKFDVQPSEEVRIGNQTWMNHDLNVYDTVGLTSNGVWCSAKAGYGEICFYTSAAAKRIAGKISGWHIPSRAEWETLINYIGGPSAQAKIKAADALWNGYPSATLDTYGFSALPFRINVLASNGRAALENYGVQWQTTSFNGAYQNRVDMSKWPENVINSSYYIDGPCSVRLIKDS
jgi:uncharacterized protein (TIGR02145 family)